MKIDSYAISMSSQHRQTETDLRQENLRYWTGDRQNQTAASQLGQVAEQARQDLVEISDAARQLLAGQTAGAVEASDETDVFELSDTDKLKIQMIQDFIERLTGKKLKIQIPETRRIKLDIAAELLGLRHSAAQARPRYGWGLAYDLHERHYESEQTTFAASGSVKTADGREINFDIAFAASREYASETNVSIRAGDALVDPLVINFAAPAASLTAAKYAFDLDADGDKEQISFVGQGSGFLTLDKNGDGIVNNGSELFGPESGNGFADLAAYDADGNNWIDENDPIYAKLSVWTKDENGNDRLLALGQTGVGAIYLGNVDTDFSYKDTANQLQGQLQRSGVFLSEEGGVGTIQQVDLAV
ncbi:hypothetical protein [Anaeroselena agilis]|uniref:VCBS repeat-containing protein n=1 Tax=Anaeroselena agilis TaxID=3063788 RepID=A0ABU3P4D9_9FIRM|nr:hypothetical protein [Selenomonadales bacterium 4137-cl]